MTTLSAGFACDDCDKLMSDPFNALIDDDDNIIKYICNKCAEKYNLKSEEPHNAAR